MKINLENTGIHVLNIVLYILHIEFTENTRMINKYPQNTRKINKMSKFRITLPLYYKDLQSI